LFKDLINRLRDLYKRIDKGRELLSQHNISEEDREAIELAIQSYQQAKKEELRKNMNIIKNAESYLTQLKREFEEKNKARKIIVGQLIIENSLKSNEEKIRELETRNDELNAELRSIAERIEIIESLLRDTLEMGKGPENCPKCGSPKTRYVSQVPYGDEFRVLMACENCGNRWSLAG
jgi:DNA-directed RNA polymerase subunit M/transcription elongation factor TFIIS